MTEPIDELVLLRKNQPRVSVVIPCYNHGAFLREALESVKAQNYSNIEVIVVNDGSTDPETLHALASLPGDIILLNQPNAGLVAARNRGIESATGEYILPLDADDRIAHDYIRRAVTELSRDPEIGIVYGHTELFGAKTGPWLQPDFAMPDMLFENMIVATALFRKEDWQRVGGYSPTMAHAWEDWDLWLTFVAMGRKVVRLPGTVFFYRIHPASMTTGLSFTQKLVLMSRLVLRHHKLYLSYWRAVLRRCRAPGQRNVPNPRE